MMKRQAVCAKRTLLHTSMTLRLPWLEKSGGSQFRRKLLLALALSVFVVSFVVLPLQAQQQRKDLGEFNLTLAGDNEITTPATARQNNPRFMAVVDEMRKGDAVFANLETSFPGPNTYPAGPPRAHNSFSDPALVKELQWMGFNLLGTANNHSMDYGIQGLLDTIQVLKQGGVVYAGTGVDLGHARAPGYLFTPHGRVALVTCASTFPPDSSAGQARPDMRGRPGISPLHYETRYLVNAAEFGALRKINDELKLRAVQGGSGSSQRLTFLYPPEGSYGAYVTYELSDKPRVITTADPKDFAALTHSIRDARELSDYVVASIHTHEGVPSAHEIPAQFLVEYAHAAVDAGADVFVGGGAHMLRGIEIYKGKVIFYSLGNFIVESAIMVPQASTMYDVFNLGLEALPSEANNSATTWGTPVSAHSLASQAAIARVVFRDGRPAEVRITPITLGFENRLPDRGYPEVADLPEATQILDYLQKLSEPYGTKIAISNGVGTITIPR